MQRGPINFRPLARAPRALPACLFAAVVLGACSGHQTAPPVPAAPTPAPPAAVTPPAVPRAAVPPAVVPPAAAPRSSARTLEGYKLEVARWIYRSSSQDLFEGAPPPTLKSVVVLQIAVDSDGEPQRVAVQRSNGYTTLSQLAMQSVRRAAPLPRPNRAFMRGGLAEFSETWLFRDDGRFQIRSLALEQATSSD